MSKPSVSVVTPSYNQARFIEDTLQSVAAQTYGRVEHVVIDGGSTDGTVDILQRHEDDVDWVSEPDDGQSDAINKGFDRASGDIVGWLNSDDVYFDVEVLERVVRYFEETDADVIYGDVALIGPNSDVLSLQIVPDFDYNLLLCGCFIEQPALFFRDYVLNDNRLDTDLEYVMDYAFWLRLAHKYEFYHVNDVLAGDRNHPDRKILDQRDAMQREAREVQRHFGAPSDFRLEQKRRLNLLTSGLARTLRAVIRTVQLHRSSPNLAFDGRLQPVAEMLRNSFRRNRNLVPESPDRSRS